MSSGTKQAPGEQAAGEVEGAELGADDVADAEVRRAHRRRRNVVTPPAGTVTDSFVRPKRTKLSLIRPTARWKSFEARKTPAFASSWMSAPTPMALNSWIAASAAALAGLVDLARGDRLGERQRRGPRPSRGAGS